MKELNLASLTTEKKKFNATKILSILSFVVFSVVLVLPFLTSKVHSGHDIEYHLSMIRSFNDAWKNGNFLSKINNLAAQDYGYANSMFYSAIPSAIAVIFMNLLHLNMTGAIALEMIILFSLNGIVMFCLIKRLFKKSNLALVCALLYQCTPYILNQFYVRFSFSEIFLSLALPLIFWGLCELFISNNKTLFLFLFTTGYSIAILCHLTMAVYSTIFVLIFLCFHFKEMFKEKKIFFLIISSVLILAITACFYLPMVVNLKNSNSESMSYTSAFLSFNGVWCFVLPWLLFSSVISLIAIVSLGKQLRFYRGENDKNAKCLFVLLNVSFIMSTFFFPWFLLPNFVGIIQYVWRLFAVNSVFVYISLAYLIFKHGFKSCAVQIALIATLSACSFVLNSVSAHSNTGFWFANTSVKTSMYENAISNQSDNYGIGSHKKLNYTPKQSTQKYIFHRANESMILDSNIEVKEFANYFSLNQISFIVKNTKNSYVTINLPYEQAKNCKFYQFSTDIECKNLEIEANEENLCLKILLADFKGESKITIAYDETLKNYLIDNPFEFIVKNGQAKAHNFVKKNASSYSVEFETDGAKIELPTLFYKGYSLKYETSDGKVQNLTPMANENGFIEIEISNSGKLVVEFNPKYVKISNITSIIGVGAFLLVLICSLPIELCAKKRKKKPSTLVNIKI